MKNLNPFDLNAVSGGASEGINWWRAGFDVSAFGIVGGGIGAIALGIFSANALATTATDTIFGGVIQTLGTGSGAALGGFGGFALGSLAGVTVAAGREIYSHI